MKSIEEKAYLSPINKKLLSLVPKNAQYILDVGCGSGSNAAYLNDQSKVVDGITYSISETELAAKFCRNVYLFNLENGLPEEVKEKKYDVVICSHVLEHVAYPQKLMEAIVELIKLNKNLLVIIALPNIMAGGYRIKFLMGKFDYTDSGTMDYTHLRWYTFKSIKNLLISYGFKNIDIIEDIAIPWYSVMKYLPSSIQGIVKKMLFAYFRSLFSGQLLLTAKK